MKTKTKKYRRLLGLCFFRRCSDGHWVIAAYHPAWSITWAWVLAWNAHGGGGKFCGGYRTNKYHRGLYGWFKLGPLSFSRQPTMRRRGIDNGWRV